MKSTERKRAVERLALCLIGCGGMGHRHLRGLDALARSGLSSFDLVGVCDLDRTNAERAADEAERLFGSRPRIHLSADDAVADSPVDAVDVVTDVSSHLPVVMAAIRNGLHVMCEKPLGISVRASRLMVEAADRAGVKLGVAENWRRDPPNRLAKAVIESGVLGHLHMMFQSVVGGDDRIIITPWRHLKERGAISLDMGVHLTDIVQYYFGPIESVYGHGFIAEPVRYRREAPEKSTPGYAERLTAMPECIEATGADSMVALLTTRSGVHVQLSYVPSGSGHRTSQRTVLGRNGSMEVPRDRTGGEVTVRLREGVFRGREVADLIGFDLDQVTGAFFEHGVVYDKDFEEADAAHLAIELHDFGTAISQGTSPEVDGQEGMAAVAAVYAVFESDLLGRAVTLDEVLTGSVSSYQDDIDMVYGLLPAAPGNASGEFAQ